MGTTLGAVIQHAAHLLPAQGPIPVFIHHNTLHAFEALSFEEAVVRGAEAFSCAPYLTEDRYRQELERGRIRFSELRTTLEEATGPRGSERLLGTTSRLELRWAMLQYPLYTAPPEELAWFMAETDALRKMRPDVSAVARQHLINETRHWVMRSLRPSISQHRPPWADPLLASFKSPQIEVWPESVWEAFSLSALWQVCCDGAAAVPPPAPSRPPTRRHRDLLLAVTHHDSDALVHERLIRFCAAFLDQALARWELPERDQGLWHAFYQLYAHGAPLPERWMRGLRDELRQLQARNLSLEEQLAESLEVLGVPPEEHPTYLEETLLALRGWAGMLWHVEQRADRVHHGIPEGSLVEYVAVRLLLERFALTHLARESLGYTGALSGLRAFLEPQLPQETASTERERAFSLFQLAQILGWTPEDLYHLTLAQWGTLFQELEQFPSLERRRLFHRAYEQRFRAQALDALARPRPTSGPEHPHFQAVFCIDEREESIRRHLEEVAPTAQTFGAAGFFGVAMYYRGAAEADFIPLCPVVVKPQHWVSEHVVAALQDLGAKRSQVRRRVGTLLHRFESATRSPALGAFVATSVGVFATIPLVARVLFPRLTAQIRGFVQRFIEPPPATELRIERQQAPTGASEEGQGFLIEEMVAIGERLLRDTGLTQNFARLIFIFGHGSTSMNNPHESAHDCGACGGARGGPNARVVTQMLNTPLVRAGLRERGLALPDETFFIGGMHNTSSETLLFYDLDRVPPTHQEERERATRALQEAATRNAHERARRFASAPLTLTPPEAREHVEGRAEDLSQVRPEWGHATNALCIVGRRQRTRGLFLDRRAFLVSYDPTQDSPESTVLTRILQAVFPVCSGINLEYYFSYVDSPGWGAGSKLPHNITSLLGVMDGAQSDLRTGLPWQMVEIHEPVRLLFVIETTPTALLRILEENPVIGNLVRHQWVQLATLSPDSQALHVFQNGAFLPYTPETQRLPTATSSQEWYTGWRDHLEFAEIVPKGAAHA